MQLSCPVHTICMQISCHRSHMRKGNRKERELRGPSVTTPALIEQSNKTRLKTLPRWKCMRLKRRPIYCEGGSTIQRRCHVYTRINPRREVARRPRRRKINWHTQKAKKKKKEKKKKRKRRVLHKVEPHGHARRSL